MTKEGTKHTSNNLRLYRRKNGLTQKTVAHLMGYKTAATLSAYERGRKRPELTNALKLEIIYRTPVSFLFRDSYQELREEIREKEAALMENLENQQ